MTVTSLTVAKCPSDTLALTNCVYFNPGEHKHEVEYVRINSQYLFRAAQDPAVPLGEVGLSNMQRSYLMVGLGERVTAEAFDPTKETPNCYIDILTLQIEPMRRASKRAGPTVVLDADRLAELFRELFVGLVFSVGQPVVMEFGGANYRLDVQSLTCLDVEALKAQHGGLPAAACRPEWGIFLATSGVRFTLSPADDAAAGLELTGGAQTTVNALSNTTLFQSSFKFEDLGIGGLADEFGKIFRRAFASRILPPSLVRDYDVQHVKGLLLYGPPGTGKTLIARKIGKMLGAREPKVVNGPEILSKYVGQSEENIRALFKDAEAEQRARGAASQLHIIIFDELDAICKQRGGRSDSTGVGDQVVNQLLSKMDGVEQLNNILVIGMTNRMDLIDEALLRPGRFEVHLEIGLPGEAGRLEILRIHTKTMRESNRLGEDVSLEELAGLTRNYTGAELAGLIRSANSHAFQRFVRLETPNDANDDAAAKFVDESSVQTSRPDFMLALGEVRPALGSGEEEFRDYQRAGIVHYSPDIQQIISDAELVLKQVRSGKDTRPACLLLHGPPGSGKTALAAYLAQHSAFPFAKILSPASLLALPESHQVDRLQKLFTDAYKSELSMVVLDGLEEMFAWNAIGPRFSNAMVQAVRVLCTKNPPRGHHLAVICTTSSLTLLDELGLLPVFTDLYHVPPLTDMQQVAVVLRHEWREGAELGDILAALHTMDGHIQIGIRDLLFVIDTARHDTENPRARLVKKLGGYMTK